MTPDLVGKIEKMKDELARLEAEYAALQALPLPERLAVMMHNKLCSQDHTEGCGWYYGVKSGKHDWNESEHKRRLEKSRNVIAKLTEHGIPAVEMLTVVDIVLTNR